MATFIHALDFFVSAPGTLVLLRAGNGHEGVHLGERVRRLFVTLERQSRDRGEGRTYLARTRRSRGRVLPTRRYSRSRRTVRSARQAVGMAVPLARPVTVALRWVSGVLSHLVTLWRVRRVGTGKGRTRLSDGRIYRDVGVRFDAWSVMMVMMVAIWQRHGRTCSLRHTCCSVAVLRVMLLLLLLLLTRQIVWWKVGRARGTGVRVVLGGRRGRRMVVVGTTLLLWCVLRSRRGICGGKRGLGSIRSPTMS